MKSFQNQIILPQTLHPPVGTLDPTQKGYERLIRFMIQKSPVLRRMLITYLHSVWLKFKKIWFQRFELKCYDSNMYDIES